MSTVTQRHMDFARALVHLARQHGMDHISASFRDSIHAVEPRDYFQSGTIKMHWSEGRHGDAANITINHEATVILRETAGAPGVEGKRT